MDIFLGYRNGEPVYLPAELLRTHLHVIGGTGKGKTTVLEAMMHQQFCDHRDNASHFIFDCLGGLSMSLLLWVASPWCPQWVRDRVVYIDAANDEHIATFNPLVFSKLSEGYYKTMRAVACVLRGFANQNVAEMPRLWRWIFNAFWAMALLGMAVADAAHLLFAGSDYHESFLNCLPTQLQAEWTEILEARSGEASRILESARNRLKPYIEDRRTRHFFGSSRSRLDVARFMREGKIVIVDVSPKGSLAPEIGNAIANMICNEIFAVGRSRPPSQRTPCYVWADEFQNYVSDDWQQAIPEMRQLNVRLILSHQSMSQLVKGNTDLSSLIWQCQSRMILGLQGEDADQMAHEIATWRYDPLKVKEEYWSTKQLLERQEKIILCSGSEAEQQAENWQEMYGKNWMKNEAESGTNGGRPVITRKYSPDGKLLGTTEKDEPSRTTAGGNEGEGGSFNKGQGGSKSHTKTAGWHEAILPVYNTFDELVKRLYYTFEEQERLEAQALRKKKTGHAALMLANGEEIIDVEIERDCPGYLEYDLATLERHCPEALEAVREFLDVNFASEFFATPEEIEAEIQERLVRIVNPSLPVSQPLVIEHTPQLPTPSVLMEKEKNPYAF